jgi:glycosyltransferase involved in cell wall biosynthesis
VPNDAATRWLYRKATARLVTTGEALRATLIRDNGIDPDRIDSIPTGTDEAHFSPGDRLAARGALGLPREPRLIGIVATLRSWKGHRYLLDAFARIRDSQARLVIVGEGPQRAALEAQVDALSLRERVVFAGQQDDVAPWLRALDVFALPSYANEGVPQALLQAMFVGVACITTDAGAIPEIARDGETALVVAKEDAAALAAGLDRLLVDDAMRESLARSSCRHGLRDARPGPYSGALAGGSCEHRLGHVRVSTGPKSSPARSPRGSRERANRRWRFAACCSPTISFWATQSC